MTDPRVLAFLTARPPDTRGLGENVPTVVRRPPPEAEEALLRGSICDHRPTVGGRIKGEDCQPDQTPLDQGCQCRLSPALASPGG